MGLWDQFAVVRTPERRLDRDAELLAHQAGWLYVRLPWGDKSMVNRAVGEIASELGTPVIGAYVADSSAACVYFSDGVGSAGELAINAAFDDGSEPPAEEHTRQWLDPAEHQRAAHALAEWARLYAPRQTSSDEIVRALAQLEDQELSAALEHRQLAMAEDGLCVVFDLLGLASLPETVFAAGASPSAALE